MHPRAAALIERLGLEPHPEGGYFREVFRSPHRVQPKDDRDERSALTTIYFLLVEGECSRWHRVRSDVRPGAGRGGKQAGGGRSSRVLAGSPDDGGLHPGGLYGGTRV